MRQILFMVLSLTLCCAGAQGHNDSATDGDGDGDSDADGDGDGDGDSDSDGDGDGDADSDGDADVDADNDADIDQLHGCSTDSAEELMACVELDRYVTDLEFVAAERPPGSPHHQAVRDLCTSRFEELGFTVERHIYGTGINVIGVREGTTLAAERVIVSAHYDHIVDCPGADDNASGIAGTLETARVLSQLSYDRTLVAACWDEEERGLIGSDAYAMRAHTNGERIVANFVYEMIGAKENEPHTQNVPNGFDLIFPNQLAELEENEFRGDFIALIFDEVNSDQHVADMVRLGEIVGLRGVGLGLPDALKNSALANDLRRSDHAPFWRYDLPGIMITDTSEFRYPQYHCRQGDDVIENLDHDFSAQVIQITVGAAALALGMP